VLMVGLGLVLLVTLFPEELGSRMAVYSETLLPDSPTSELVHRTQTYPMKQLENAFSYPRWPYGWAYARWVGNMSCGLWTPRTWGSASKAATGIWSSSLVSSA
jgi:hypothetical protein